MVRDLCMEFELPELLFALVLAGGLGSDLDGVRLVAPSAALGSDGMLIDAEGVRFHNLGEIEGTAVCVRTSQGRRKRRIRHGETKEEAGRATKRGAKWAKRMRM
jgi:hypothetical protein